MQVAEFFVAALALYGSAGVAFAIAFVLFGIHCIDPIAEHSPIGFRLIIIPGATALWPLLLTRWFRAVSRSR
jgi:hypothetical protein